MRQFALLLALAIVSPPSFAVYKCQIDGKIVYRDASCPGGTVVEAPPPQNSADAQRRVTQERSKLDRLERERHRREAAQQREERQAAKRAATLKKKCDSLALHKKWADEDAANASGRAKRKAQTRARRAEERMARECS